MKRLLYILLLLSVQATAQPITFMRWGTGGGSADTTWATLNPLDKAAAITLVTGDLSWTSTSSSGICRATQGISSGQKYWETYYDQVNAGNNQAKTGISQLGAGTAGIIGSQVLAIGYRGAVACFFGPSSVFTGLGLCGAQVPVTGSVVSHLLDMTAGTYTTWFNGAAVATTITSLTGTWYPTIGIDGNGSDGTINFGQTPFIYTPPVGYTGVYTTP